MVPMAGLQSLKILTLSRNQIRQIKHLDTVAGSLEQLWLSYNQIERLDGLANLPKLHTLYVGNCRIRDWGEVAKCKQA